MPVHYEVEGRVATITIDRPEAMNALDPPMLFGLAEAWDKAEDDDDVWVVVVTGAGDQAFCVGADLKRTVPQTAAAARGERDEQQERWPSMARTLLRDRFFPKPIVAAVNGHCIAGGFGLLLATDPDRRAPVPQWPPRRAQGEGVRRARARDADGPGVPGGAAPGH